MSPRPVTRLNTCSLASCGAGAWWVVAAIQKFKYGKVVKWIFRTVCIRPASPLLPLHWQSKACCFLSQDGLALGLFSDRWGKKSLCHVAEMICCRFRERGGPLKSHLCGQAVEMAGSSCSTLRRPRENHRLWSPGSQSCSFSGIPAQPDFLGADLSSPTQLPCASSS